MKKLISILLMCLMLISNSAVLADKTPSLEFLKHSASIRNVEQNGTVSFKLNEPFGLLELFKEDENLKGISNHIDVSMLFESLFDSTMSVSSKSELSEDGKKRLTEGHIKSNIGFKANNNLEGDFKTNYSVWSEIDFSDENNPYFGMIMTHPFAAKYITADSNLMFENGAEMPEELLELYKMLLDGQTFANINDAAVKSIEKNALITGDLQKVKIVFNDIGLKMYLVDIVTSVLGVIDKNALEAVDMETIKNTLSKVPIFGNEAMVMEYTLDSNNRISEEKTVLNVDLNIYDLMSSLGTEEQLEEREIARENCRMNFTIESNTSFNYDSVKIEKPVLTEENSIDIFEYEDPYYYYSENNDGNYDDEEYDYYYPRCYANIDRNCFANGEVKYVQLRSFFEDMGYSICYDNGAITAKSHSKYVKHKEFCFFVDSDIAYTEIQSVKLCIPLLVKDGVSYISVADCENLTNMTKDALYYNFETQYGNLQFYDHEYANLEY